MSQNPILHALAAAAGAGDPASDADLLRRFAESGDRTALELVVRRHADLVWGVCRAALPRDPHAAEDAFQATFLALVRKAGSVRAGSAAGWLFRVARNAAVRARAAQRAAAPLPEALAGAGGPADDGAARREVAPLVAEEVDRLAASLRDPVVLCFFEGHTHAEAAARLGWPVGTVASRLARAKAVLRARLTRRGVVLPAVGLGAVFGPAPVATAARVQAALAVVTGPTSGIPPSVLSLTQGVLSAMRFTKLKVAAALVLVAAGLTVAFAARPDRAPDTPADPPKKAADAKPETDTRLKPLQGKWRVVADAMSAEAVVADPFGVADIDRLSRIVVTVAKDKMITDEGRMEAELLTMALRFPADGGPQAIDLVVTDGPKELFGTPVPALYKLDGDKLTLCVRDTEHLDKGRPKEFKSDKTQSVEVLERVTDEKAELKALAGAWAGRKLVLTDEEVLADKTAKPKWVFDGADVVFAGAGELGERATLKLDPAPTPPTIELTVTQGPGKGTKLVGVYSRQENRFTICFRDPKWKDVPPPTALTPGADVLYYTFERAPKK